MHTIGQTPRAIRPLTSKQRRYVHLLLEGRGKSEAYRLAYPNGANSHTVSVRACRIAKQPAIKAALLAADSGDWAGLLSCGIDPDFVAWKKLLATANDPSVQPYVQVRALHAARRYKADLDLRAKQGTEEAQKSTFEEIEKILRSDKQEVPAALEEDDDLSLDLDPAPITGRKSEITSKELPFDRSFQSGRSYQAPDRFMSRSAIAERVPRLTSTHPRFRNNS